MRRLPLTALAALLLGAPLPLQAQRLREQISGLFIFGPGQDPLFLAGSADPDNPASIQAHGTHFVPASAAENASVISFITGAIGGRVASMPVGSTSGGETFRFEGSVPVRTSTSAGPIFAERALTLGRGRALAGLSRSGFHLQSLRGVDLHNVGLTFTHENVHFAGCDEQFGDACAKMGVPALENDVIEVRMSLDIDVRVTSFYLTYGVTDRLDVGAVVPVVSTSLRGESTAQIQPFGGTSVAHFFAGTPTSPVLDATRTTQGSAIGLGDVSLRAKASVRETPRTSAALLADARFATGSADDLLGSGAFAARALAIVTTRFANVSTHANAGYGYRAGSQQNDAVLGTIGFDSPLTRQVTLAAELLSELQVGQSRLSLPPPVLYDAPFRRTVIPTAIPDTRDDIVNGSFGFKVMPRRDVIAVVNALFPLNRGGLRPGVTYTGGVEFAF
jgi:hypothetical protein